VAGGGGWGYRGRGLWLGLRGLTADGDVSGIWLPSADWERLGSESGG
jgi:hypothetical protein